MAATLFFGFVTSALGIAYMAYGRRQAKFVPLVAGLALCVYSYFIDSWLWLGLVGAVLLALPFIVDF